MERHKACWISQNPKENALFERLGTLHIYLPQWVFHRQVTQRLYRLKDWLFGSGSNRSYLELPFCADKVRYLVS